MDLPELTLLEEEQLIVSVACDGISEGEPAHHESEDDDAQGEEISDLRLVVDVHSDLRSSVALCATEYPTFKTRAFRASDVTCHAKVDKLQVELSIENDVFELEVSVADASLVHGFDGVDELKCVVLGYIQGKTAVGIGDVVIQLTALSKLV